jgi:hypothetical protein
MLRQKINATLSCDGASLNDRPGEPVMSGLRPFQRRSFLQGVAGGAASAGIATAPPTAASFLVFDVTAANRGELTALFRALTRKLHAVTTVTTGNYPYGVAVVPGQAR